MIVSLVRMRTVNSSRGGFKIKGRRGRKKGGDALKLEGLPYLARDAYAAVYKT